MNAHEQLFAELDEIRRSAPEDAHRVQPVSPQIDPVRVFAGFASKPSASVMANVASLEELPDPVRQQRNPLWQILKGCAPQSAYRTLDNDLAHKHQQPVVDQTLLP